MARITETSDLLNNVKEIATMGSIDLNTSTRIKRNEFKVYHILYYIYASMLFSLTIFFQQSISPITDVLQKELNITSSSIGLLSSSYFIAYFIMQLPFGVILQRYSHHIILLLTTIGLTISWMLFGFINSFIFALIIRIFSGLCGAPTWIIIINLVGDHFGNNQVGFISGITILTETILVLLGVTIQGYVYEKYEIWREIYYFIAIIGFIMVIAIILTMYCQHHKIMQRQINGTDISWIQLFSSKRKLNAKSFERQQVRSFAKLKTVLLNKLNWWLALWGFAAYTIHTSIIGLWLTPFLMTKFSYSRTLSSFYAGSSGFCCGFGSFFFGYLMSKCKKRKIFLMIQVVIVSTFLFLMYLNEDLLNKYIVFIIVGLVGFGYTTIIIFPLVREYNAMYEAEETATGFVNAIYTSSGLIAGYSIGLLIDYHSNGTQYTVNDYQFAFSCVVIPCLILLVITTFLLKETNAKNLQ